MDPFTEDGRSKRDETSKGVTLITIKASSSFNPEKAG